MSDRQLVEPWLAQRDRELTAEEDISLTSCWEVYSSHVRPLIEALLQIQNQVSEALAMRDAEIQAKIEETNRKAKMACRCYYVLFVIGSVLTIYGQFLDKVVPKT